MPDNITQEMAKQAYNYAFVKYKNDKSKYNALPEVAKKAAWQYGYDRKLVDVNKLGAGAKAEYQRYVDPNKPEYRPAASDVQQKFPEYYKPQSEKLYEATIPKIIQNSGMIGKSPKEIMSTPTVQQPSAPQVTQATPTVDRRLLNAQRLEELTPTAKPQIAQPQLPRQTNARGKAVVQQGKVPMEGLIRPDNPFAPAVVNAVNTASLGLLERNTDAIQGLREKAPITSTVGSMAGYLLPFGAAKGALVKGTQTLGKRVLTDAALGIGVDTATEAIRGKETAAQAAGNVGQNAIFGIAADLALSALGSVGKAISKKLVNKQTLSTAEKAIVDSLPDQAKKEIILYVDPYGNVRKTPGMDLQLEAPKTDVSQIAPSKNIEAPFRLTPAEQARITPKTAEPKLTQSDLFKQPTTVQTLSSGINTLPTAKTAVETPISKPKTTVEQVLESGKKERGFAKTVKGAEETAPELKEMLEKDVLSYDVLANKTTQEKAEAILSKGYTAAKDEFDNYVKFGKQYEPDKVVLGEKLSRQAAEAGNLKESYDIIGDLASKLTEAGQFIQSVKILHKSEPEGMLRYLNNELKKINTDGLKKFGNKWNNIDLTEADLKLIQDTRGLDDAAKDAAMEEIAKRIASQVPSTFIDKVNSWRRMAMLLNPKTHIRNVGGNLIYTPVRKVDDAIAQVFELAIKKEKRTKAIGWSKNTNLADIVNADWDKYGKSYLQGSTSDRFDFGRVLGQQKTVFKSKFWEGVNKKSFELLEKGDIPFFKTAYTNELGQYMKAQNITEVSETARKYALKKAEEATYRDLNAFSELLIGVKKKTGIVGEAFLPFAKTPANITKRAVEHSPAGIITTIAKAIKDSNAGTFDSAKFVDGLAKGTTGSGIIGIGFMLHKMGVITGAPDKDKDKANFEKAIGKVPYAVKMGDNYYSYDWAQPVSALIAMGAAMSESLGGEPEKQQKVIDGIIKEKGKPGLGEITFDAIAAGGDALFNMSMLQSLRRIFGNSYDSPTQALLETILQYPRQAVPTLLGQAAQASDPYERQVDYSKKLGEGLLEYGKSRAPGLRQQLPVKVNIKGEQTKTPGKTPLGRAAYSFLSPSKVGEYKPNIVDNEVMRLYDAEKDKTIFPRTAPKQFTVNKVQYELSVAEQNELQKLIGKNQYELLGNLFKSGSYKLMTDKVKVKTIQSTLDKAVDRAKMEYKGKKGIK